MRSCKSPVPCCACYPTCGWVDDLRVAGGRMMMTLSSGEKTGIWADSEASDCIIWQSEVHGCKRAAAFGLGHAPCLCALEMTLGDAHTKRRYNKDPLHPFPAFAASNHALTVVCARIFDDLDWGWFIALCDPFYDVQRFRMNQWGDFAFSSWLCYHPHSLNEIGN